MIDLCELLRTRGLSPEARVKLVRHQTGDYDISALVSRGQFDLYQSNQSRPVFNCDCIVSFLGERHSQARLLGVYRVVSVSEARRPWPKSFIYRRHFKPGRYWYDLERQPAFEDLVNRVIVDWGASPLAWHQWLGSREVVEILPAGYVREFPGYDDVLLTYDELRAIFSYPSANREWHRALGSVAGVYLITDTRDGRQYVGSASGRGGLLGRWGDYARTGHGGNKRLRALLACRTDTARHFQFSILRALPATTTSVEVLEAEVIHKRKLGSHAFGLNHN